MHPLLPVAVVIQRLLVDIPCRVDDAELAKVPAKGPLIAVANHIGAIEIPMMLGHLYPRLITGMAKTEAWQNPIFNILYTIYRAVPVRRGEGDLSALKLCLERLAANYILAVAPEGTRNRDGKMRQAYPGVALMAVKSGAPLMPFAHFGGENLWTNLRRFKRTPITIHVGNMFTVDLRGERMNKEVSQQVVDEIMWQVAALMPPYYRGYYSNLDQATEKYLRFAPGMKSNLSRAAEMDQVS